MVALTTVSSVEGPVAAALASRTALLAECHAEGSNAYRLVHGAVEGLPGTTLDRYGDLLLWQTFREPPDVPPELLLPRLHEMASEALTLSGDEACASRMQIMWSDRRRRRPAGAPRPPPAPPLSASHAASELGLRYLIGPPAVGKDPGLFLDVSTARLQHGTGGGGADRVL
jgi:23S rRNA (cytosine1962-C5)-methyltransferase